MGAHVVNEEAFCLKWNDFHTSLTSTFTELRAESDLLDATIVCEGQALRAHKLVLSASSVVFRQLFRTNGGLAVSTSQSEPVVLMWDVKADDLKSLLNFMYEGEVNVGQDNLNSFLALAERLQVRGLTSNVLANNNRDGGTTRTGQTATRPLIRSSHPHHQAKRPRTDGPGQDQTIIKEELPSVDGEHPTENAIYDNATSTTEPSFNSQYPYYEGSSVEHQHGEDDLRQTGGVVAAGTSGTTGNNFASTVPIGAANHALNADSANHGQEFVTGDVDQAKGIVAVLNSASTGLIIPAHPVNILTPIQPASAVTASATSSTASSDSSSSSSTSTNGGRLPASSSATSSSSQNNSGTCMHCNKTFRQLRSHIQDVHCPTPTPCPLCGKVFSSKHKMFGHKYRSCPNRTRNLVRHLQDLEQVPGSAAANHQDPHRGGESPHEQHY